MIASRKKQWLTVLFTAVAAALLLAACSSLVPDQPIQNPLALDSQRVPARFPLVDHLALPGGGESSTYTFADIDLSAVPGWLKAASLTNRIAVRSAQLDTVDGPDSITLSDISFTLELWQGAATYGEAAASDRLRVGFDVDGEVVLTKGACTATACDYTADASGAKLGTLDLKGATLDTALNILAKAPTPNSGRASVTVQGPDALYGHQLTLVLDAEEGKIRF